MSPDLTKKAKVREVSLLLGERKPLTHHRAPQPSKADNTLLNAATALYAETCAQLLLFLPFIHIYAPEIFRAVNFEH